MNIFTHYSIQQAFNHIDTLVERAKELGFNQLPITDLHTLSGCPEFLKECKKHKIKPILGCTFRLGPNQEDLVTLFAKNKNGWKNLIKLDSTLIKLRGHHVRRRH
jgi:DNA polymerase-3 subunit alpha